MQMLGTTGRGRRRQRGVTLIELMVVMVVVAILGSIALASYRAYVQRAGRAEAKAALLQQQNNLERCFTRFNRYDPPAGNCLTADALQGAGLPSGDVGRYLVTGVFNAAPFGPGNPPYVLTATPQAGGGMTDDAECLAFTLTATGQRGVTGTGTVQNCWR